MGKESIMERYLGLYWKEEKKGLFGFGKKKKEEKPAEEEKAAE